MLTIAEFQLNKRNISGDNRLAVIAVYTFGGLRLQLLRSDLAGKEFSPVTN